MQDELELLGSMFQCNKDIFSWTHLNMLGIHLVVAFHKLNVLPISWPIQQRVWHFHLKKKIIQTEIDKLLAVRFIKEVKYLD